MALAEKLLAAEFNRDGHRIVDHHTYVFFGDGCLMEGISHEACALAGAWRLDKLIARLRRQRHLDRRRGRAVVHRRHAEALRGLRLARHRRRRRPRRRRASTRRSPTARARTPAGRPLICCKTTIGKGAPTRAGTAKAHGEALGVDEVKATREALGWTHAPFVLPDEVYAAWDGNAAAARPAEAAVARPLRRLRAAPSPSSPPSTRAAWRGELPARWRADRRTRRAARGARQGRDRREPQGEPDRPRGVRRRRCPSCSAAAPTSPARNFTEHRAHTPPLRFAEDGADRAGHRRAGAAATSTTACANSAWRRS